MNDERYSIMLEEIDEEGENLTDWEIGFVGGLIDNPPVTYSTDQRKKIKQIHERRIPT